MSVTPFPLIPQADIWTPADSGFISALYDPATISNNGALTNGTIYFSVLPIRAPATISKVWFGIFSAAVTPTAGQNFFGLYGPLGGATAPLLSSVEVDALITATGAISGTLTTPQAVAAGLYATTVLINCATPPNLYRQLGNGLVANANLSAAASRFFHNGTLQTALPGSITLANNISDVPLWTAVS